MGILLKPGEYLEKDIRTATGVLLVQKGTRLTVDTVNRLKKFSIDNNGIAVEHTTIIPQVIEVHEKTVSQDGTIEQIEQKVDAIKYIFTENINPKEMETVAIETASNIVADVSKFSYNTNVCINDLRVSDEYTYQHSVDVAVLATMLGKNVGLSEKKLSQLAQAGLLHDIGKSKIPSEILNKPARLTADEMVIMRTHSQLGYEIARDMADLDECVRIAILQHHEKVDGSGYPYAASTTEIHQFAKIICIADIYDALTHKRCYKPAMTSAEAFSIMVNAITTFDAQLFVEFFKHITFYPINSEIILNDGTIWKVIDNSNARQPKIVDSTGYVLDLATSSQTIFGVYTETMMEKWRALHM